MRLYRYMTMSSAMSTIHKGMWRLGRITDFNDPFDCLFAFRHGGLSMPEDFYSPFSMKFRNEEFSKYGILCFSRNCSTPAMWAHYAQGMTGVCFECEMPESESLYPVEYSHQRLIFDVTDDRYLSSQECRDHVTKIIQTKHSSWSYEEEQRVFLKLGEGKVVQRSPRRSAYGDEPRHWIQIDPGVIQRVIVGPLATDGDVNKLKELMTRPVFKGVGVLKARIHPTQYRVDI